MKVIIAILILVAFSLNSHKENRNISVGQCILEKVDIFPESLELSQNPIILIDYDEQSYRAYEKLQKSKFYLVDSKGRKYNLKLIQSNKAFYSKAQILLKADCKLKKRRFVSIKIDGFISENELDEKFIQKIQSKKWFVKIPNDNLVPEFKSEIDYKYINDLAWSHPWHGVKVEVNYSDDNSYLFETNDGMQDHILIEVSNEKNEKYLIPTRGNIFWISAGMCSSIFELKQEIEYVFKVKLIDFSGNESKLEQMVKFITTKPQWD